jgi:hypothetical protein
MICIELSPYFGNKVAHEVNYFRGFHWCFWFAKLHQKAGAYVEIQIERTVRPLGSDSPCAPRLD